MTTTASSTPTKKSETWQSLRTEVRKEIMNTDVACEVQFTLGEEQKAEAVLLEAFDLFRNFESRYSRFIEGNELWQFNRGSGGVVSPEFFRLVGQAKEYYGATGGLFDPSILPVLEHEGYVGAASGISPKLRRGFAELSMNRATSTVTKPRELVIDFGGIGKGFIVDRVADFLGQHFENFLIDAGGDIYVSGVNKKEGYAFWAVEVENQQGDQGAPILLTLKDMAVATSGVNRRFWDQGGQRKHHIIDPTLGKSAATDFTSVTVIAPSTTAADVWAKALYIAGQSGAKALADSSQIPAVFVGTDHNQYANEYAKPYLWKS